MLLAIRPFVIALAGVLVWVLSSNAILKEIGKWCFIVGLFWTVSTLATKTVKIGSLINMDAPAGEIARS